MHLNSLGPVSCFLHPSGLAAVADGMITSTSFHCWYGRWHSLSTLSSSVLESCRKRTNFISDSIWVIKAETDLGRETICFKRRYVSPFMTQQRGEHFETMGNWKNIGKYSMWYGKWTVLDTATVTIVGSLSTNLYLIYKFVNNCWHVLILFGWLSLIFWD